MPRIGLPQVLLGLAATAALGALYFVCTRRYGRVRGDTASKEEIVEEVSESKRAVLDEIGLEHRRYLRDAEVKSQEEYDRTVITLSGGAIGVSFAFLKDLVGTVSEAKALYLAFGAWVLWGLAIALVLISMYFGTEALKLARCQLDAADASKPGGAFASATILLNPLSGTAFMVGLILMVAFVARNV
jgi:hypothetical protein